MTFTEFLNGTGKGGLARTIDQFEWPLGRNTPIPKVVHERLLEHLRLYQYVGGMPEAVSVFADSGSLRDVSGVHANIIDAYRDDFPKYAAHRDMTRMLRVFNFAARQPGRKVKFSNISPVDYVVELAGQIVPIEVKAGRVGTLKSLHQFVAEKETTLAVRFDASPPSLQKVQAQVRTKNSSRLVHYWLVSLPLYLVERLQNIVGGILNSGALH